MKEVKLWPHVVKLRWEMARILFDTLNLKIFLKTEK